LGSFSAQARPALTRVHARANCSALIATYRQEITNDYQKGKKFRLAYPTQKNSLVLGCNWYFVHLSSSIFCRVLRLALIGGQNGIVGLRLDFQCDFLSPGLSRIKLWNTVLER
jgi:hypothetical protein